MRKAMMAAVGQAGRGEREAGLIDAHVGLPRKDFLISTAQKLRKLIE